MPPHAWTVYPRHAITVNWFTKSSCPPLDLNIQRYHVEFNSSHALNGCVRESIQPLLTCDECSEGCAQGFSFSRI